MEISSEIITAVITATTTLIIGYWQWKKPKGGEVKPPTLKNHPFFSQIEFWITYVAPNIPLEDKRRRRCVRVFLILKLSVFRDRLLEQVEEIEAGNGDICSIASKFIVWCKEYEDKARDAGVPPIFIKRFSEWHEPCITATFTCCSNLCGASIFHPTPEDKMGVVLDLMQFAFQDTLLSAETTLANLNGELSHKLEEDFNNREGLWRDA